MADGLTMTGICSNPCFIALKAVCDEFGLAFEVEHGGKHPKLVVFVGPEPLRIAFAASPSDRRAPMQAASYLRRQIEKATSPIHEASMSRDTVTVLGKDVVKVEYKGQRVVTLKQIDAIHERPEGTAGRQFREHRGRFREGVDYFDLTSDEIRRMCAAGILPERTARATLFTERGYGKIVKGWNDDLAWSLHDAMQDAYFVVREIAKSASEGDVMLSDAFWKRIGGVMKSVSNKATQDIRSGFDMLMGDVIRLTTEVERLQSRPVLPAFDLAGTVTSRDIMDMAGIPRDGRVRGTTGGVITRAMKDYCLGHGFVAQRAPESIDPDRRWRFPRQAALDWLTGTTMGGEIIRNHIARSNARRARKGQQNITLVPAL